MTKCSVLCQQLPLGLTSPCSLKSPRQTSQLRTDRGGVGWSQGSHGISTSTDLAAARPLGMFTSDPLPGSFWKLLLDFSRRYHEMPWDATNCGLKHGTYSAVIFRQVPRISHPLLVRINCCRNLHIQSVGFERRHPKKRQLYLSFHFPLLFRFPRYGF